MSLEQDIERRIARDIQRWQQQTQTAGQPTQIDEAWLHTPEHLRLPFQVLKSAGIPPQEVELFQQRAQLRARLDQSSEVQEQRQLRQQLSDLEQQLAMRLEALRSQ
ncbi:uncharacterized protein DUF1992 [Azomonas agilis]|uniref:Uncharacterized protein DUF1992 n=1 Tax=Azomonas agilis TaxID=116849 RepID=A0A562IZV6_9GAMM|nr:DUF1992 domain-containing protein [Azomonas agilis]TWH76065.1 uncharacterized protein DUF1992 [Azomonas agilis]